MLTRIICVVAFVVCVLAADEGDDCYKDGNRGLCTLLKNCPPAIQDIQNRKNPMICSFAGREPIVCCVQPSATVAPAPKPITTTQRPSKTTTEYIPDVEDYEKVNPDNEEACEEVPLSLTSPKTGQKAWDKCVDYQHELVMPCGETAALTGTLSRQRYCYHNADELIVGGSDASLYEFPHMTLLGFGEEPSVQWLCGGALISDRFILTAAHCLEALDFGPVTYVMVGILVKGDPNSGRRYRVKRTIPNPGYEAPSKYNDIALLELESRVKLDKYTVPACLHVGDAVQDDRASATGWGLTKYKGSGANILQKVILTKFTTAECSEKFPEHRHMTRGFDPTTQMCYGDKLLSKDTCQGDSGGPLQIKSKKLFCMYTIIGITSFGRACGFEGEPGIYTRVAPYMNWIESVVWP